MIVSITNENFTELIEQATKPVIIDVYAVWCGPCHYMLPIYEEVAAELGDAFIFAKLNVDEAQELAVRFSVSSVPTFIFMENNTVIDMETGTLTKEALINRINTLFS